MISLNGTYFGFTNNLKPMQKAKFEATLDKYIRYDGKVMTEKIYALNKLIEGFTPSYEENHTYYSKRLDGMTKPKTLYTLENNGVYSEVSKTVYSFVLFLIENGINTIEKAEQYAKAEQEQLNRIKAEENRIKDQLIAEEKVKAEIEKQKRQEQREIKLNEWKMNGLKLMNDSIKNSVSESISDFWNEIETKTNLNQDSFTENAINAFTQNLGNEAFIMSNVPYVSHDEMNKNNLNSKIYKSIYSKVFNINEADPKITITSKIKAFYNGKEYKGTTTKNNELETFYVYNTIEKQFEEKTGTKKNIEGFTCYIYKNENDLYRVIEGKTGLGISGNSKNKSEAIQKAKEAIQNNKERLNGIIDRQVEKVGLSPLYATNEVNKVS